MVTAGSLALPLGNAKLRPSLFPSSSSSCTKLIAVSSPSSVSFSSSTTSNQIRLQSRLYLSGTYLLTHHHQRLRPVLAVDPPHSSVHPVGSGKQREALKQWDWLTAKFAGAANVPFLLLQLPQIILNFRNLSAGNNSALLAVPWLAILTGLLGNLCLLSYFVKKKETEAVIVQTLGVISMFIVLSQLAVADAMPLPYYTLTSAVAAIGLISNFLNFFGMFPAFLWRLWEDFITVGSLSVLPQVMWSTFVPYIPNSMLPGSIAFVVALAAVVMARMGKLSEGGVKFVGSISGWTATLLFMWMPIAQMWTNFLNPENIRGLSSTSMLLAMIGNGLMLPRALFIRDLMWFTGSSWATILYGWGNLVCMCWLNSISKGFFIAATAVLSLWIGMTFWKDTKAHGYDTPFRSLKELIRGH